MPVADSVSTFAAMVFLGLLLFVSGCTWQKDVVRHDPAPDGVSRIAVFPVENLSGSVAPSGEMRGLLIERLGGYGIRVLDDGTLERVITSRRVRYTGGVEPGIARALRHEAGVEAILIPTLELYDEGNPPKVAMFCRLVSTDDVPKVLWIDGRGLAGDDEPGLLDLGLIEDPGKLLTKAVESLAGSLAGAWHETKKRQGGQSVTRKFRPKIVYRSEAVDPTRTYSVAIVPFFNKSYRKNAGQIVALHMIRNLMVFPNLEVVEPGLVRQELLRFRIIMSEGVSLSQTETVLDAVNADLVLNGEVLDYQDYGGSAGNAKVDFSVLFIERRTRKIVYSSYSQNASDDGVVFFDWGRVNTAHAMAAEMAKAIGERMVGK